MALESDLQRVLNSFNVVRSSFLVTIPFNFVQLLYQHKEPDGKSLVIAELKKDQSFR